MYTPTIEEMVAFCGAEITERHKKDFQYSNYSNEMVEVEQYYRSIYLKCTDKTIMLNSPYRALGETSEIDEMFQLEIARHCPEFLVGKFEYGETDCGFEWFAPDVIIRSNKGYITIRVRRYGDIKSNRYSVKVGKSVLFFGSAEDCASYAYRLTLCWLKQQEEKK